MAKATDAVKLRAIRLRKREERRLLGGHLWIYSNEVDVDATPFSSAL